MKTINAYEFGDLKEEIQEKVREKILTDLIDLEISLLGSDLDNGRITETDYYNSLGCSKRYAETTGWFVPSCYYEKNKPYLIQQLEEYIKVLLFDKNGKIIDL